MTFRRRIVRDATDVDLCITGSVAGTLREVVFDPAEVKECVHVKVTGVFHSIETGVRLHLFWEGENGDELMMPLEGRGILDLTRFGGLENPHHEGSTGRIILEAEAAEAGPSRHFALTLELLKQRR